MVAYQYKGVTGDGKKVEGQVSAETIELAERKLISQSVTVLYLSPATGPKLKEESGPKRKVKKKITEQDASVVLRNLAIMAETGVPFIEALDASIAAARTPAIESAMTDVKDAIIGGQSLSNALKTAPQMFPPIIVDMIKIAETGGRLDQSLGNGAVYLERVADLRRKIINAMLYPMVMLGVSVLTIGILVIFVMPKFAGVFSQMKAQLPITTQVMLNSGNFVRQSPLLAIAILVGIIAATKFAFSISWVRDLVNAILFRMPIVGELLKRLSLARALQSISTLSNSNVPLLSAIEYGAKVAGNKKISQAFLSARDEIEKGKTMSEALQQTGIFPKNLIQMVGVGERTGRLPALLNTLSKSMEEEVDSRLKALVAIIEPIMIVTMGVIVGTITISIIGPIYSVVENIK